MNIPLFKVFMSPDAPANVSRVLTSGYIGQGEYGDRLEAGLQTWLGTRRVNAVNSCTSAIHLALYLFHPLEKRTILTTPLTCLATNAAIVQANHSIRWVDVDPDTGNMNPEDVRKEAGRMSAVVAVHWGGYPCDLDAMRDAACSYADVAIIEDCAHAFGSYYKGHHVGTQHGYGCFSFQAIKHLTAGDGGALVCPTDEQHKQARLLRWYGLDRESNADFRAGQNVREVGFKYHMNDIAASIGCSNLPWMKDVVGKHKENAAFYDEALRGLKKVRLMRREKGFDSASWVYTLRVKDRTGFIKHMASKGIVASVVHARNDLHDCFQAYRRELPGLDELAPEIVCIPCGWWVGSKELAYVVEAIAEGW